MTNFFQILFDEIRFLVCSMFSVFSDLVGKGQVGSDDEYMQYKCVYMFFCWCFSVSYIEYRRLSQKVGFTPADFPILVLDSQIS